MISSMTGFGRAKKIVSDLNVTVEIKSVNHRYFEFYSRVPRNYGFLEEKLKGLCREKIARGKIEMSVAIENLSQDSTVIEIDHSCAAAYIKSLNELSSKYRLKNDIKVSNLAAMPEIFKIRQNVLDDQTVLAAVTEVANEAIDAFINMRMAEGEKMVADIKSRVATILESVEFIDERSPETVRKYRERIEQKIKELLGDRAVDEQRLLTETAIFADKVAVAEETVRLRSHIEQLCNMLDTGGPVGRNLDFIVQEMNREINTIGSKTQDIEIAHTVVAVKAEIEKIREQVQNIE